MSLTGIQLTALSLALLVCSPVRADNTQQPTARPAIVLALKNSVATQAYGGVGMLLSRSCPNGRCGVFATCSLVLVAPDVVVTAAHCVENPNKDYWVFLPGAGLTRVAPGGVTRFCDGKADCDPVTGDLASLRLSERLRGIEPIPRSTRLPPTGRMVGYGDSNPSLPDNGILKQATVPIDGCEPQTLCYRFDRDSPAACNHDSGGPMLSIGPGVEGVAGPAMPGLIGLARQSESNCTEGLGTYTRVTGAWVDDWWRANVGSDGVESDRLAPAASRPVLETDCSNQTCWLSAPGDIIRYRFQVSARSPPGPAPSLPASNLPTTYLNQEPHLNREPNAETRLIVTMNYALRSDSSGCTDASVDSCIVDYDLALAGPDGSVAAECRCENSFHQVSVCSCPLTSQGEWTAIIKRVANRGPFQLQGRLLQ
ncbi:MAG: trypsin-like serine protease [Gammaproteobacteria bacterium]